MDVCLAVKWTKWAHLRKQPCDKLYQCLCKILKKSVDTFESYSIEMLRHQHGSISPSCVGLKTREKLEFRALTIHRNFLVFQKYIKTHWIIACTCEGKNLQKLYAYNTQMKRTKHLFIKIRQNVFATLC